jgi:hypothetical protein
MKTLLLILISYTAPADSLKPLLPKIVQEIETSVPMGANSLNADIIALLDDYEKLYQSCILAKNSIKTEATGALNNTLVELDRIRQLLNRSDQNTLTLRADLAILNNKLLGIRSDLRKAKRRAWFERAGSSAVIITLSAILINQNLRPKPP